MTQRASVTQAAIRRVVTAMQAVGLTIAEVKVSPDGEVRVICQADHHEPMGWDE